MTSTPERIDTLKILDQIEDYVEHSFSLMGFYRLDLDEFSTLTNKLRASLPEDMRRAGRIAENSSKIMTDAQIEAEQAMGAAKSESSQMLEAARAEGVRIVQEAHAEAARLVDAHELARQAAEKGEEVIAHAHAEAQELHAGAEEYARESLALLEQNIKEALGQIENKATTLLATVQKGRQQLERQPSSAAPVSVSKGNEKVHEREPAVVITTASERNGQKRN